MPLEMIKANVAEHGDSSNPSRRGNIRIDEVNTSHTLVRIKPDGRYGKFIVRNYEAQNGPARVRERCSDLMSYEAQRNIDNKGRHTRGLP